MIYNIKIFFIARRTLMCEDLLSQKIKKYAILLAFQVKLQNKKNQALQTQFEPSYLFIIIYKISKTGHTFNTY